VFAQYTIFVDDRRVQRRLEQAGISTAVHYLAPLTSSPRMPATRATRFRTDQCRAALSLPMHAYLSEDSDRIVDAAAEVVRLFVPTGFDAPA
jgi:dTDP-4-amino-4,6-dideoxygalactose transaminase